MSVTRHTTAKSIRSALRPLLIALLLGTGIAAPSQAQTPPVSPTTTTQTVDETALRYFARTGDTRRLAAEIARLKVLYPNWTPPADPLAENFVPDPDIEAIWKLFSDGDFTGTRAAIAAKQAKDPQWSPTPDLLHSLTLGENRLALVAASNAGKNDEVIRLAANVNELLVCSNIDLLWRLAEAFAKSGKADRAADAYTYILQNCQDPAQRLATVQKALPLLDRAAFEPLFAFEIKADNGTGEFDAVRLDLARADIAAVLDAERGRVPKEDIDRVEAFARKSPMVSDLLLLGWYDLQTEEPLQAQSWFQAASDIEPSIESAMGLATALIRQDEFALAETTLAPYRSEGDEARDLYMAIAGSLLDRAPDEAVSETVLKRIVAETVRAKDAQVAEALGWYAYNLNQTETAAQWFRTSLGWDAAHEPSAYGLLVASDRLRDKKTVADIRKQWAGKSARITSFGNSSQLSGSGLGLSGSGLGVDYAIKTSALFSPSLNRADIILAASCTGYVPPETMNANQALTRAWCLMDQYRPTEARASFARALISTNVATRRDAAYGLALAALRLGLTTEAAVAAAAEQQPPDRALELQVSILTQTATSAYNLGHYEEALIAMDQRAQLAPEQNDLLVLRAWSYYHLKRVREAKQIFKAVAATGYPDALAGLAAVSK